MTQSISRDGRSLEDWLQTGELDARWDGEDQLALLDAQVGAPAEEEVAYGGDK